MFERFLQKGGEGDFNDTFLRLDRENIDELEAFLTSDANPKAHALQFCGNARRAMDEGDAVYYYCWG